MYKEPDMSVWQGRMDKEDKGQECRWFQAIKAWDKQTALHQATAILGFACDEGVKRNKGRVGAAKGPIAIRKALTNLSYQNGRAIYDAGDVFCKDNKLEQAQEILATHVSKILQHEGFPLILGGGHEIAWGSFLGLMDYYKSNKSKPKLGIINFDAHFDLRCPSPLASSGTPFHQIAEYCDEQNITFNYLVLGLNPFANTHTLFEYAKSNNVVWFDDVDCNLGRYHKISDSLEKFIKPLDELYLSICLDVFSMGIAPGVSAPSALGIHPNFAIQMIRKIRVLCDQHNVNLRLCDIAEMNPTYDVNESTAKLAARLCAEVSLISPP